MTNLHKLQGKTLLLLDGTPNMINILSRTKELGIRTVIANFYEPEKARAKLFADAYEVVDIKDLDAMEKVIRKHHADGILQGCTDSHLPYYYALCKHMHFPCYGTLEQFKLSIDKKKIKALCRKYDVPVTPEYAAPEDVPDDAYPVIVKPADDSGSRGFSVCRNAQELREACAKAEEYSLSGEFLIEKFMPYERSVIIHYTLADGRIYYSGMSDKVSRKVSEDGSPIMALQYFPSYGESEYLSGLNAKVIRMFEGAGFRNGVIWIEAFYDGENFTFNEMGYRFGGSLTYYPVEWMTGIKQLDLLIEYALTGQYESLPEVKPRPEGVYCIFPMHVRPGVIKSITGIDKLKERPELFAYVPFHVEGDVIEAWGSAKQVFSYIHFTAKDRQEAERFIDWIISTLYVAGESGEQLLYNIYRP